MYEWAWTPPASWFTGSRRVVRSGDWHNPVWLWEDRIPDIARIERAYWTRHLRAERAGDVFEVAMRAIFDAGGVAYCACHGNCEQPCFYRYSVRVYDDEGTLALTLDDHAKQTSEGMRAYRDHLYPEAEPIRLDLGNAYYAAERALGRANSKKNAWRNLLLDLLRERLNATHKATANGTGHLLVNGRDYWFRAVKSRYGVGYHWEPLLTPEMPRVELTIASESP